MKQLGWLMALVVGALVVGQAAFAVAPTYTEDWDGRGTDSERCELERSPDGWIHWVFSTKGDSTSASLILGGTGSGTYAPGEPLNANVWHFYTPFFELDGLTATIELFGGEPGSGGGLVISDWCDDDPFVIEDILTVEKTAETYYERTHEWDISKVVETEHGHELDGYPKIWLDVTGGGDETATWTVDVTYEGYDDTEHNVSGEITIENSPFGGVDVIIVSVTDVLAGSVIDVDCGVAFPYTLASGETLTCTYSEDGYVVGVNEVTVVARLDVDGAVDTDFDAEATIVWGDPDVEHDETVNVEDVSDLFGTEHLGTVTAPNGDTFTYDKDFAWDDYGADDCGSFRYDNTATIVETEQSADATLKVNVQCYVDESAWAQGEVNVPFCDYFANWGWTNPVEPGTYEWPLYAGAGQCDITKGTLVGYFSFTYGADGSFSYDFDMIDFYTLESYAVYADVDMFPTTRNGRATVAPGQYDIGDLDGSSIYVIAHAVVGVPDPNFGP